MEFLEVSSRKRKRRISDNRTKLPSSIQNVIEKLFEKKFKYEKMDDFTPNFNGKQLTGEWEIKEFISWKNELNLLKNELNDKDMITWHKHTRLVNLAGNIAPEIRNRLRPELCTQAWCKFYEIASTYLNLDNRQSLVTVHLCEAPGAFVTSLNHYLFTHGYSGSWQWLATTLNPYYENNDIGQMINEDKFIRCSYGNWYFGEDGTGNLISEANLRGLEKQLAGIEVDLVTADGSIDCQGDPAEQENVVSRLQHCEVFTALQILSPGGTLVVKMFTLFECKAIGLMYLLNCVFEKVEVFKPCTSKGGNSEVYVIGLNFKGRECCQDFLKKATPFYFGVNEPEGCLFSQDDIPEPFLDQHKQCVHFFKECQMSAIQRNLDLLKVMTEDERSKVEEQKDFCVECFFNKYNMKPLPYSARIMKTSKGRKHCSNTKTEFAAKIKLEGKFTGSFCERQELSTLPWQQKINKIETYEDEVNREDNSLWIQCQEGMSEHDIKLFQAVKGKPVDRIHSSRFCHGFYLGQVREIVGSSKWLSTQTGPDKEFVKYVAAKSKKLLSETIQYYSGKTTQPAQTHPGVIENVDLSLTERGKKLDIVEQDAAMSELSEMRAEDKGKKLLDREQNCNGSLKGYDTDCSTMQSQDRETGGSTVNSVGLVDEAGEGTGKAGGIGDETGASIDKCGIIGGEIVENTDKISDIYNDKTDVSRTGSSINKTGAIDSGTGDNTNKTCETERETGDIVGQTGDNASNGDNDISKSGETGTNKMVQKTSTMVLMRDDQKMDIEEEKPTDKEDGSITMGEDIQHFTCTFINSSSPVLQELSHQSYSDGTSVRLYSVSAGNICDRFELVEQEDLLSVIQDILKNCEMFDYVVIEMGTCLSRFTAGLVYILYRTFREVGFVHHHGNLMKRHLVCVNYQHCPVRLYQYLEEVGHMTETDQSDAVLEIVPILTMLDDEEFTSFLRISNVNLLQSFITTVVNEEKQVSCHHDKT